MGLNVAEIKYLQLIKKIYCVNFKHTMMLGRQFMIISDSDLHDVCKLVAYCENINTLKRADGFSENLLMKLFHAEKADSLDYSDYEMASIKLDLNNPIPGELEEKYNLVLDGGTLEHIFNYPMALQNAMKMCCLGGHIVLMTPTNNYNGHGFYQFSPELFWDVLDNNGFQVEDISYMEEWGSEAYKTYKIISIKQDELIREKRAIICVCAKKIKHTPDKLIAQQGQYIKIWNHSNFVEKSYEGLLFYDLNREIENQYNGLEKTKICGKTILFYGAGKIGRLFVENLDKQTVRKNNINILGFADKNSGLTNVEGFEVENFENYELNSVDYIVITTNNVLKKEIQKILSEKYSYPLDKIMDIDEFLYYLSPCLY